MLLVILMAFTWAPLVLSTLIAVTTCSRGERMHNYFQSGELHKGEFAYAYTILHPGERNSETGGRSQRRAVDADGVIYGTHHSRLEDGQQNWSYFITQGNQFSSAPSQYHVHRVQGADFSKRQGRLADGTFRTEINYAAGKQPIVVKVSPRPFVPFPEIVRPYGDSVSQPVRPQQAPVTERQPGLQIHGAVGGLGHPSRPAAAGSEVETRSGLQGQRPVTGGFASRPVESTPSVVFSSARPQQDSNIQSSVDIAPGSAITTSAAHPFDRPSISNVGPGRQPGMVVRDGPTPGPPLPETVTKSPLTRPSNGGLREVYRPKPPGVFYVQGRTNPNRRGLAADASSLNKIAKVVTTETPLFGGQVTIKRPQEDAFLRYTSSHIVSRVERPSSGPGGTNIPRRVRQGRLLAGGWHSGLLGIPSLPTTRPHIQLKLPATEDTTPHDGLLYRGPEIDNSTPHYSVPSYLIPNTQVHIKNRHVPKNFQDLDVNVKSPGQIQSSRQYNTNWESNPSPVVSSRLPASLFEQKFDTGDFGTGVFTTVNSIVSDKENNSDDPITNGLPQVFSPPSPITKRPLSDYERRTSTESEESVPYKLSNIGVTFRPVSPENGFFKSDFGDPSISSTTSEPSAITYRLPNGAVSFPADSSSARPTVEVSDRKSTDVTEGTSIRVVRLIKGSPSPSQLHRPGDLDSKTPLPARSSSRTLKGINNKQPTRNTVPLDMKRRQNNITGKVSFKAKPRPSLEAPTYTVPEFSSRIFPDLSVSSTQSPLAISVEEGEGTRLIPHTNYDLRVHADKSPDLLQDAPSLDYGGTQLGGKSAWKEPKLEKHSSVRVSSETLQPTTIATTTNVSTSIPANTTNVSTSIPANTSNVSIVTSLPAKQMYISGESFSAEQPKQRRTTAAAPEQNSPQSSPAMPAGSGGPSTTAQSRQLRPEDFREVHYYSGPPILSRHVAVKARDLEGGQLVTTTPRSRKSDIRVGKVLEVTTRSGAMPVVGELASTSVVLFCSFLLRSLIM